MKHFICTLLVFLQSSQLFCHGFSADTLVLLAPDGWQEIGSIVHRAQKNKITLASYDTTSSHQTTSHLTRGGHSTTNCFVRINFEAPPKNAHHNVICAPTQEFYCATTLQWIPAYMPKIGDELLCAHNVTKKVASISLIKEPLDIFTLEVKHTHTFFVTQHALLTHNMVLPIAFNVGLSIPFGAGTGSAAGGFFGPVTFVVGAAIGCIVGALVKIACENKVPRYTVETYDANRFEQQIKHQPQVLTFREPQVTLSADYNAMYQDTDAWSADTHSEHVMLDDENETSFSITIQNPPKEKPGCGNTTPQKPLIYVTPADPMPVFENPGYNPQPPENKNTHPHGGCGGIPDELKDLLNGPMILTAEDKADDRVNNILDGATYIDKSNEGTKIYSKPKGYTDALEDFESMQLNGVKIIKNGDGLTGSLSDGKQVNVRKTSKGNHKGKDKWPTLEIRSADGKRSKIKIRYTKENA